MEKSPKACRCVGLRNRDYALLTSTQESPIYQLQVTFAALQHSSQNVYNPKKLVDSLRLPAEEQQDAQE